MKRLLAFLGLTALVVGVPATLVSSNGPPYVPQVNLSETVEALTSGLFTVDSVLRVLGLMAWVVWAYVSIVIVVRVSALTVVRRSFRSSSSLIALTDRLAPSLLIKLVDVAVGTALLLTPIAVGRPFGAGTAIAAPMAVAEGRGQPDATSMDIHSKDQTRSYAVRPGDSLWKIGKHELGSGFRWPEIFDLNRDRMFPDGKVLRDPRLIRPNWVLWLPSEANGEGGPRTVPAEGNGQTQKERNTFSNENGKSNKTARETEALPPAPKSPSSASSFKLSQQNRQHKTAPTVILPSGGALAASFASGILASQALAALRRRRRYRPLSDPEPAQPDIPQAEAEVVVEARRANFMPDYSHLRTATGEAVAACRNGTWPAVVWAQEEQDTTTIWLRGDPPDGAAPPEGMEFFEEEGTTRVVVSKSKANPVSRRSPLEDGLLVPAGFDPTSGTAAYCGLIAAGPVSLSGPLMNEWTVQALLSLAADYSPEDLQIFVLGDGALTGVAANELAHIRARVSWSEASKTIHEINDELAGRGRLFARNKASDVSSYLETPNQEYVPALIIVAAEPPNDSRAQLDGIAAQAARFGGGFVALGWEPRASSLKLTFHESALGIESTLPIGKEALQPFLLDQKTVGEVAEIVAAAHPEPEKATDSGESEISDMDELGKQFEPPLEESHASNGHQHPQLEEAEFPPPNHLAGDLGMHANGNGEPIQSDPPPQPEVTVRCFGPLVISREGTEISKGWDGRSKELLAYLVAHPEGAPKDRLIDVIWPHVGSKKGDYLLRQAIYYMRKQVFGEGDLKWSEKYVTRAGEIVKLDQDCWDIDAWRFQSLIASAEELPAEQSVENLRQAVSIFRGDFCDDTYFSWLEPVRERFRRTFIEASVKLSELMEESAERPAAIAVLERAIEVDPICEDLYRRAMRLDAANGNLNSARIRHRRLAAVLAEELGEEPDPATEDLMKSLVRA